MRTKPICPRCQTLTCNKTAQPLMDPSELKAEPFKPLHSTMLYEAVSGGEDLKTHIPRWSPSCYTSPAGCYGIKKFLTRPPPRRKLLVLDILPYRYCFSYTCLSCMADLRQASLHIELLSHCECVARIPQPHHSMLTLAE